MVEVDNVVRCYRGIDPVDGYESFFAVKNGLLAPSMCMDDHDSWLTVEGFGHFDDWCSDPDEHVDKRLAALDQFELLWEKQE